MSIDPAGAEPLNWLISLTGAAVVVLAALWRLRRSRSVSARVVNADADSDGAVEVRLEEPGRGDAVGTSLRARRRSEVGVPLALVAGDRVQVRPPRRDRQHVIFALTPMSMFPGVLALYGLMLIWVGIQLPADASEARPAPVVFAALAVVPFLTAGWFAGRCWFWLTARRVRGTVVDSRPQTAEPTPGWKSRESRSP